MYRLPCLLIALAAPLWAAKDYRIVAELQNPLTTASAKVNDEVRLEVLEDAKSDGKVVVPKGAKLTGHVSFVQKKADGAQGAIAIVVDKGEWKGQAVELRAVPVTLQSIGQEAAKRAAPAERTDPIGSTSGPANGRPGLQQPDWMVTGSGAAASRVSVPVPKDCGMENDGALGAVFVCDNQQVALGPGARIVLKANQ